VSRKTTSKSNCLIDHVVGPAALGPPHAVLSTTFELGADFVEYDFLPSLLSLSNGDDRSTRARLQLEEQLAKMDVAALLMDAECYRSRPCSLRVHVRARQTPGAGRLHAKVTVIVHNDAVRLIVGSANLTESGYRSNREVALSICATAKRAEEAAFILEALEPMPAVLGPWWSAEADRVRAQARALLQGWASSTHGSSDRFAWSGNDRPLWRTFAEQWPAGERLKKLIVVSPFWSSEHSQGPLAQLLRAFHGRDASTNGAEVRLLTNAVAEKEGNFLPQAHPSLATFDVCGLGVDATIQAVDPRVDDEGFEKDGRLRNLHAKVLLAIGPTTTLAYVGSANFTNRGWCFGHSGQWNIEAGVLLRREGKAAAGLSALLPKPTGKPQRLDGSGSLAYRSLDAGQDQNEWPSFIDLAELAPDESGKGDLSLRIDLTEGATLKELRLSARFGSGSQRLWEGDPSTQRSLRVPLSAEALRALLVSREVLVEWAGMQSAEAVAFPLNVAALAREQLPFSTSGQLIGESALVAFYQGQLSFEDLFPKDTGQGGSTPDGEAEDASGSAVDTTTILSYQIREFVEALPGIRQELERAGGTISGIRHAFVGPVSPLALASTVEQAVTVGRSPVAGAFQLIELVLCIRAVIQPPQLSGALAEAWHQAHREADQKLLAVLEKMLQAWPSVRENAKFRSYQALLDTVRGAA
jgi:hypothetical protein